MNFSTRSSHYKLFTNPVHVLLTQNNSYYAVNFIRHFGTTTKRFSSAPDDEKQKLTHVDAAGKAVMVDVGEKNLTQREAVAVAIVRMPPHVFQRVRDNSLKKGDVLSIAQIAGIMGAKHTSMLIPLCHNIVLDKVHVECSLIEDSMNSDGGFVRITCTAKCTGKTGVEMEALTGASIGALCVYDMCKAVSHDISYSVRLVKKTGGKSDFRAENF